MPPKQNIIAEVKKIGARLTDVEKLVSKELLDSLVELAGGVLTAANKTCPYEFGELRNSGTAVIHRGGSRDLQIVKKIQGAGPNGGGEPYGTGYMGNVRSYRWVLEIGYTKRIGGFDVASYFHNNLQPYRVKSKDEIGRYEYVARKPGTGPRWLANAVDRIIPWWISSLSTNVRNKLKVVSTKRS